MPLPKGATCWKYIHAIDATGNVTCETDDVGSGGGINADGSLQCTGVHVLVLLR
jgi:hypothetical protein